GPLFGRIETKIAGQWLASDFMFYAGPSTLSVAAQIDTALWATHLVRSMASDDNRPFSGTDLSSRTLPEVVAVCSDFADTLLRVLAEANVQLPARRVEAALNPNHFDVHTLVELLNSETQRWMLLDPTFDLTVKRSDDGTWATATTVSSIV